MQSFEPLLSLLATIPDPRRAEGKLYQLRHVLLFSIFAMISGANSYRSLRTYFRVHRQRLNEAFQINWKSAPAHTAIRYILHRLTATEVEKVFREHAANLNCAPDGVWVSIETPSLPQPLADRLAEAAMLRLRAADLPILRQHQPRIGGERAEHLPGFSVVEVVETALQRLAVERDDAGFRA